LSGVRAVRPVPLADDRGHLLGDGLPVGAVVGEPRLDLVGEVG
jgi:hypothetical protein